MLPPMIPSAARVAGPRNSSSMYPIPYLDQSKPKISASTRRLSASFATQGPLSSHPTTAFSSSIATSHPGPLTSHPVNLYQPVPGPIPLSDVSVTRRSFDKEPQVGGLKSSHTISNLPVPPSYQKRRAETSYVPSSAASTATTFTTATVHPHDQAENIPPGSDSLNKNARLKNVSSFLPKLISRNKSKSRSGIPKSRTLNVFTSITSSLSRTSLSAFSGSESRKTSTSSAETSQHASLSPSFHSPRQINTAMSSEYWTGRFMALQDRFQSEMLLPDNMTTLVHAHAERSLLSKAQPTAVTSLTKSATSNCLPPPSRTIQSSPRKPAQPLNQVQNKQQTTSLRKYKSTKSNSTVASSHSDAQSSRAEAAALLADEDNRCRRIFLHLEAMCATDEAHKSLRTWQQSYARKYGRENLLPRGGSMIEEGRVSQRSWVERLLSGSNSSIVKRGSFAS
ncbi:hypothetical protein F5Y15DRAFT_416700 [Xylariaceae sp. FL0016]|nr:hypothetical protein F5Y15DRAFT_416700 [Xylariaceae sp. FL0016]